MRLAEAEDMLRAIRHGEIDAFVVERPGGNQVYTLHSAEEPYRTLVEQMQEGAARPHGVAATSCMPTPRFAALVGQPLESVVGSRLDRFVHGVRQTRRGSPDQPGQRSMSKPAWSDRVHKASR